jgi:hypothetical protein
MKQHLTITISKGKIKLLQSSFMSLLFSNYFYINQAQETNKLPKKDSRYKQTGKGVVYLHSTKLSSVLHRGAKPEKNIIYLSLS